MLFILQVWHLIHYITLCVLLMYSYACTTHCGIVPYSSCKPHLQFLPMQPPHVFFKDPQKKINKNSKSRVFADARLGLR